MRSSSQQPSSRRPSSERGVSSDQTGGSLDDMASGSAAATGSRRLFDSREGPLIDAALGAVAEYAPADAAVLLELVDRLVVLNQLVSATPSLRDTKQLGLNRRNEQTLVEHLTGIDGLAGDLELPFKGTLSRTFLLAKIQFLRGLVKSVDSNVEREEQLRGFSHRLRDEYAQSVYTLLAEELLLALLRKRNVTKEIKRRAADQLIWIWDDAQLEIDAFCPLLESAWHARNRVSSRLGSLLGTAEYFRLVAEDCPPQFLDFFCRDEVSRSEGQAFEEFLFNMTYEELNTLGECMREEGLDSITTEWASEVLGRDLEELDPSGEIDPVALYRSYYRRQLAADFRIMAGTEGPRRTAEAYLMIYLLDQQE